MKIDKKTLNAVWGILLFSILAFPRIFPTVKILLCLLLIILNLVENKGIVLQIPVVCFMILWMAYALLAMAFGILYKNPYGGIYAFLRSIIVNALLYCLLMMSICREDIFEITIRTVFYATLYISIYNLIFIACGYLRINLPFLEVLDATARLQFHEGYSHVVTTNLSMTICLFPLVVMLINEPNARTIVGTGKLVLTAVLCAGAMVLSGRRILWLCLILGVVALFFINARKATDKLKLIGVGVLVLGTGVIVAKKTGILSIDGLVDRFKEAFASIGDNGLENVRIEQARHLLNGFKNRPFFGNGAGAIIKGYARSIGEPWNFELSYHEMLFQSGLVGAIFYFSALALIFVETIRAMRVNRMIGSAVMVSYVSGLAASGTNPYFNSSFDLMIFLFLPFVLAEVIICSGNADAPSEYPWSYSCRRVNHMSYLEKDI